MYSCHGELSSESHRRGIPWWESRRGIPWWEAPGPTSVTAAAPVVAAMRRAQAPRVCLPGNAGRKTAVCPTKLGRHYGAFRRRSGLARSDAAGDNLRLCGRLCARPLQRHRPLPLLVDARGPGQGGRLWRLQAAHSAAAWHRVLSRPPERVQREQRQAVAELPGRKVAPLRAPAAVGAASGVGKVGPVLCARRAEVHTHGAHTLTATAPLTLEYRTT